MVRKGLLIVALSTLFIIPSGRAMDIDPMVDFRYPVSLFEMLHEGIVQIIHMIKSTDYNEKTLNWVIDALVNLHYRYDSSLEMHIKKNIKSVDKEFLEQMLARIISLVQDLDGYDDKRACIVVLCERFAAKIMNY